MDLLLHLPINNLEDLPLDPMFPRVWPYTQMVNRVLIDQLDPFHYSLACEPICDILKMPNNNKSFSDMLEERAVQLKSLEEPIYIMFSGGLDSSAAVLAFMNTWSPEELKRVHIASTHMASIEFPELWGVVAQKFKGRIHNSFNHVETFCEKGYVVTGEHGDQILGSDLIKVVHNFYGNEGIRMPWQKTIPEVLGATFGSVDFAKNFIERYDATLPICPFPIKTSFDWVWWFNFTNKWQSVKYRLLKMKPWNNAKETFKKIIHFFDSPEWQRWSIDNHDLKIHSDIDSYKFPEKKYIVDSTGWERYYTKPKLGSLSSIWTNSEYYEAVDTEFNFLIRKDVLTYIR